MLKKFFVKSNVFVILTSVVLSNVLFASEDINIATKDTLNEIATNDLKDVVGSSGKQTAEKNIKFREIIFINDMGSMTRFQDYKEPGVYIKDMEAPNQDKLIGVADKYIGKQITMEKINKLKGDIADFYANQGFPIVSVLVPADQDISIGKVYVLVLSSKVGQVKVAGVCDSEKQRISKMIKIKSGNEISSVLLNKEISWINSNPFRTANLIYEKGEDLGYTDLTFQVVDKFPFKINAGYENSDYQTAGDSRWIVGFNWGNLFKLQHQLNAQVVLANNPEKLWNAAGNYVVPLPWRHIFKIFGTYSHTKPQPSDYAGDSNFNLKGKMWQIGLRYQIPLIYNDFSHELIFGYDYKQTNNFLNYSRNLIYNRYVDISNFIVRYECDVNKTYVNTSFGGSVFLSPGKMTKYNRSVYYNVDRAGAKAEYMFFVFNFDNVIRNASNDSWVLSTLLQISPNKLLPSQQFSLGGHKTVRGYQENEVIGDNGFLIKNELRTRPLRPASKNPEAMFQIIGFCDFGIANRLDQNIINETGSAVLTSVGPGLRFYYKDYFNFALDYGIQLKDIHGRYFGNNRHSRAYVSAFVNF